MKRTQQRDRIFLMALSVSLLLHLSMVTVFRIVIYFPRYDMGYYRVSLIEATGVSAFSKAFQPEDLIDSPPRFEGAPPSEPIEHNWLELPTVNLPRLSFSELEVPNSNRVDTDTRVRYAEHFEEDSDDLWAQVGEKLSTVGDLLVRSTAPDTSAMKEKGRQMIVGHPAPGFVAVLEWMSPPYTREAVLVEKVEVLWGAPASILSDLAGESVVLIFRVNRMGGVTFVQMPLADEAGVVHSSAQALKQYLFAPVPQAAPEEQYGTLSIRVAMEGETP